MQVLYCSPTGNTKYLANHLAKKLGISVYDIKNKTIDQETILMFSIHGFNPTRTVKRFVKQLKNDSQKVHLISVGCAESWINEAATLPLKKILVRKGYSIGVDELLAMPLTLVMEFPEETAKNTIKTSIIKIESIASSILNNGVTVRHVPLKSRIIRAIGTMEDPAARLFGVELYADKKCTSCGICWNRCPENNIKEKNGRPKFGWNCMLCLRCVYECPEESIKPFMSRFIPQKRQYSLKNYLDE